MRQLVVLAILGAFGCRQHKPPERWAFHQLSDQSQTGPQPFVTLDALGSATVDLIVECAPTGLELSFRGQLPPEGATLRFDDAEPLSLPLSPSRRGVPKIDLEGTVAERLATSSRLAVDFEVPAGEVVFDVTGAGPAIERLGCQP